MPIMNYKQRADCNQETIFKSNMISDVNKQNLQKFLIQYDVSNARRNIFLSHIKKLLISTKDIMKDMHNRDTMNKIFQVFRQNYSVSYYATIINCSLRFTRWLNNGKRPDGFIDIKNINKNKAKRDLKVEDMISWEDGKKMIQLTNSIQLKAVLMVQLDAGLRPSEFIDLNYGDVEIHKNGFITLRVSGKTGKRDVTIFNSVPYLQQWLRQHPTKDKNAPLWVIERMNKSNRKDKQTKLRYSYDAIKKRIKYLGIEAKLNKKHYDFYTLRHSACTIAKLENLNPSIAAEKFGHSVDYFEKTYGRLDKSGMLRRFARHYNLDQEKINDKNKPQVCERCETVNQPDHDYCSNCSSPLRLEIAMKSHNELDTIKKEMLDMKHKYADMIAQMNEMSILKRELEERQK